jgi:hypothetical protein
MAGYRDFSQEQAAVAAESALSRASGERTTLEAIERLGDDDRRNLILRAQARTAQNLRPVIVKATRSTGYAPSSPDAFATSGFVREWTARTLLASSDGHARLGLLAGDAEQGVMVFADLGHDARSLVAPLLDGSADEAGHALAAYAVALARLHAATTGWAARHADALHAAFPSAHVPASMALDWLAGPAPEIDGVALPCDELAAVRARIGAPGPWFALVHGDLCPDNVLFAAGRAWPIDFEFSAPGHALLDAVYWRMGFPTCWCAGTLPAAVANRMEAIYRRELTPAVPEVADDRAFAREMATVMLARLPFHLRWLLEGALEEDRRWGIATNRSRILWYLRATIDACERAEMFPGSRAVALQWLSRLQISWPDSEPLPVYPAFSG